MIQAEQRLTNDEVTPKTKENKFLETKIQAF